MATGSDRQSQGGFPLATGVVLLVVLLTAGRVFVLWPELPSYLASHFDVRGQPDAWTGKGNFVLLTSGSLLLPITLLLLSRHWFHRIPVAFINLPHKDFWTQKERLAVAFRVIGGFLSGMAVILALLGALVLELSLRANLSGEPRLSVVPVLVGVAIALGYGLIGTAVLFRTLGPAGQARQLAREAQADGASPGARPGGSPASPR